MGEEKKWNVTYTKHVKQKRKVYQDGFLWLHSQSHKVILYDDCEKVLDSRPVKKDDIIKSGETLAFDSYLVDIGDHKPIPDISIRQKETKETGASRSFQSPKIEDRNPNLAKDKARLANLSPSHKIIREFKKSEICKYGTSPGCPETTKVSKTEWQVLYTTHITQKAKKYHDGFLQLLICGSQGKQVMLYDATRRLLDSRFLRKDEVIRSGESVAFDSHLVDIGECEGDNKPPMDLNFQGRKCNEFQKIEAACDQIHSENRHPVEWEAMYTTHLTQKSKKYNSGILKFATCGSYKMQVILLTEDGTILSRRFLQSSESLRTGSTLRMQKYLVELGRPRANTRGDFQSSASYEKATDFSYRCSGIDNIKLSRRVPSNKPVVDEEPCKEESSKEHLNSNIKNSIDENNISSLGASRKPVRAALEILSILKKPMTQKDVVEMERKSTDGSHASQSSYFYHSDTRNQINQQSVQHACREGSTTSDLNEGNTAMHEQSSETSKSKAANEVLSVKIATSDKGESQTSTSGFSIGSGCSSEPVVGIGCSKRSGTSSYPPTMDPEALVATEVDLKGQQPIASVLQGRSTAFLESRHFTEAVSCTDDFTGVLPVSTSGLDNSEVYEKVEANNVPQPCADCNQIAVRMENGVDVIGMATSNDCTSHDCCDQEEKITEQDKSTKEAVDVPSFDLGF